MARRLGLGWGSVLASDLRRRRRHRPRLAVVYCNLRTPVLDSGECQMPDVGGIGMDPFSGDGYAVIAGSPAALIPLLELHRVVDDSRVWNG